MFKQIRTPLLAATALVLCSAAAQSAELAANGGFETGDFTGWTQFENGGTQLVSMDNPSSGIYSANLIQDIPNNSLIKNANIGIGVVNPGDVIRISFDMRGVTEAGGLVFAEFFSELAGGGVSQAEILGGGPLFGTPDWVTYNFETTAGSDVSGGVTLQLGAVCGGDPNCNSNVFFDNVSVSTVPVPAALWLFGSALGLLGWKRRKG